MAGHDDKGQRPARQQRVVAFSCLLRGHIAHAYILVRSGFTPSGPPPTAAPRMRGAAARALALSKIAARSPPTQPPMEEAPVTRRLVVLGKERTSYIEYMMNTGHKKLATLGFLRSSSPN